MTGQEVIDALEKFHAHLEAHGCKVFCGSFVLEVDGKHRVYSRGSPIDIAGALATSLLTAHGCTVTFPWDAK